MINITFPDGSVREYEQGVTGHQIAESISPALARSIVSCGVNGEIVELNRPINEDATIALYKFEDEEGKHTFWHTSAHLLAEALKELYPGIQFGFGPAVENGFFYDVLLPNGEQIKEGDFANIEKKMLELAKKDEPVVRKEISKADALASFGADGQTYKCEHIDQDLEDGTITTYTQGNFTDLCKGPHLVSTGSIKAVKLTSIAGAFWRGDAKREQMQRLYGISFPKKKMLFEHFVMSKAFTSSSRENTSCSVPGFQPNNARKLTTASGKYPLSRYPDDTSPLFGSCHSNGKTGKPRRSQSLFDSLPLPSGFSSSGRWANCGMVSSQPKAL